jgi:hypothetical protein
MVDVYSAAISFNGGNLDHPSPPPCSMGQLLLRLLALLM